MISKISDNTLRTSGVSFYTDGGAHNNGPLKGLGSWAFVQFLPDVNIANVYCGYINEQTTNNRAEMIAVINAIKFNDEHTVVDIISDSGYVVRGYNHPAYLDKWVANGWHTSTKEPVSNRELWEEMLGLSYRYGLKFRLIKGHYKDPDPIHAYWNAIVDRACTYIMQNNIKDICRVLKYDHTTKKFLEE